MLPFSREKIFKRLPMTSVSEILEKTTGIFRDVLENDTIVLAPETNADDIEEWDSFTHIQLIVAVEKQFKIRFTAKELSAFKNVGEMCDSIQQKLN